VRLCAEDPAQEFMPQAGRFGRWSTPEGIRVDTAMSAGAEVPPYYDSMVAKLVAQGPTRDGARLALASALDRAVALGIATNQGFLRQVLLHPAFAAGEATTGFIASHAGDLVPAGDEALPDAAIATLALFVAAADPRHRAAPRHLGPPLPIPMVFETGGQRQEAAIHRDRDGSYRIALGDSRLVLAVDAVTDDVIRIRHQGAAHAVPWLRVGDALFLQRGADQIIVRDVTRAPARRGGQDGADGRVLAAMNGRVVAVHVAPGDTVAAGQPVATLEAMKMEHVHVAAVAGTVGEIAVAVGDQVTTGRLLAAIDKTAG
jgi:geranyl-CoA carboxylase alpha subunit